MEIAGRLMAGRGLSTYQWSCRRHSKWSESGGVDHPTSEFANVNGIMTNKKEAFGRALDDSAALEGYNVHNFHNSDKGTIYDIMECLCMLLGIPTHAQEEFNRGMKILTQNAIEKGGSVFAKAHSQGGIMVNNLTKCLSGNQLDTIRAYTLGTAKIVKREEFGWSENYISKRDPIALFADTFNFLSARLKGRNDVIFLNSNSSPGIDHRYDGATYKEAQNLIWADIRKRLGIQL